MPLAPPPTTVSACPTVRSLDGGQRESLEEFLARARVKQAELLTRLNLELDVLVKRFEALNLPPPRLAREALIEECVALGPEATPLLVRWLEAGDAALDKERFRAGQIALVLARLDTRAATDDLLTLLAKGSKDARVLVATLIETTPEAERVRPVLLAAFKGAEGKLREALLRTLLQLSADDPQLLDQVMGGEDDALRNVALNILTDTKNAAAEERVHRLLSDQARSPGHAQQLLMYYQALPELVGPAQLKELLALAGNNRASVLARGAIIDSLPVFVSTSNNELKKALEPIINGPDLKLADAARIVLARLGDRAAKRELLKPFDDVIESTPKWSQAYARRAEILRRIAEYREAEKDYARALQLGKLEANSQPDTYVGLAKCAALQGHFKEAATWLQQAPIQLAQLKAYANDPDFAKLRASKYGDVFPKD